jgi:hypothetical protein
MDTSKEAGLEVKTETSICWHLITRMQGKITA